MTKREYDESDVRIRPGRRGSRPRTKQRPDHADAAEGMVVTVDRGRWTCAPEGDSTRPPVTAMRARELGRTPIVVGDRVGLIGDLSGAVDSLARIVRVEKRSTVLRRTAEDEGVGGANPPERVVVANAEQLVIVTAVADPVPRTGFVDRCLVAAYAGGLRPVLCLTKADLADPEPFAAAYRELDFPVIVTRRDQLGSGGGVAELAELLAGRVSALVGHSGVGKSTLVNVLVPDADRAVGVVSSVGKGRHTTVAALALPLPRTPDGRDGWVVDTPGVRSFGLAHVTPDDIPAAFEDLASAIEDCPRGCGHLGPPADPECALDARVARGLLRPGRLDALRRVLVALR